MLSEERKEQMPSAFPKQIFYEHDVDLIFPVLAFNLHQEIDVSREYVIKLLKDEYPEAYEQWAGEKLDISESRVLQDREFIEKHKNKYIVTTAFGEWFSACPKGFTLCVAQKNGDVTTEKAFLVPKDEYKIRRPGFGFVIDLEKHKEVSTEFLNNRR